MDRTNFSLVGLQELLAPLGLKYVRFFETIDSTNAEAGRWVAAGAPGHALVIAEEQSRGRGRLGRHWFTPRGAALAFSLILHPAQAQFEPVVTARFTALGALAVCDALQDLYELEAEIKWPNDVLLARHKVAGVLAEAHWQGERPIAVVLGVGVNVYPQAVPSEAELLYPATSVQAHLPPIAVDRSALLKAILASVLGWMERIDRSEFLAAWDQRLAFRREWVKISEPGSHTPIHAQVIGLAQDGALQVITSSGEHRRLIGGDLSLRPAAEANIPTNPGLEVNNA